MKVNSLGDSLATSSILTFQSFNLCHMQGVDIALLGAFKTVTNLEDVAPRTYEEQAAFIDKMCERLKSLAAQADQLNTNRSVS